MRALVSSLGVELNLYYMNEVLCGFSVSHEKIFGLALYTNVLPRPILMKYH